MQVAVSNKELVQRYGHSAASSTISPECMEVVLFGGQNKSSLKIADTAVLRFGKVPLFLLNYGTHCTNTMP